MSAQLAVLEANALLRSGANWREVQKEFRLDQLSDFQARQFRMVWGISQESGGELAGALERLANVFEQQQKQLSDIRIAFSTPKATANLILGLPILALLIAELVGLRALSSALGTPLGIVSVSVGVILLIVARVISLAMLIRAQPAEKEPGAIFDAIVIALSAGLGQSGALEIAKKYSVREFGNGLTATELSELRSSFARSERLGMSVAKVLAATADAARYRFWQQQREDTSRLTVSLLLPLGLIALPAYLLLAVVPLAIALFQGN